MTGEARIQHIFLAALKGAAIREVALADALQDQGLEGDRNTRPSRSPGAQLTLIEGEHIEGFCKATGFDLQPGMPRRNLVTRGVRLNDLVGRRFRVGEAVCEGIELCEPCRKFQARTHVEVLRWFAGKGGLRARIVEGGVIRPGDAIVPLD
jgi:MOSC domain-containing protein YiiM